jgi:hypothetical protein
MSLLEFPFTLKPKTTRILALPKRFREVQLMEIVASGNPTEGEGSVQLTSLY